MSREWPKNAVFYLYKENYWSENFGPIDLFLEDTETNFLSGHWSPNSRSNGSWDMFERRSPDWCREAQKIAQIGPWRPKISILEKNENL